MSAKLIKKEFGISKALYNKSLKAVELFFEKMFPIEENRDLLLTHCPFLLKNVLKLYLKNELSKVDINFFISEINKELSKENVELKDWITDIIVEEEDEKDSDYLFEKYKRDFPNDFFTKKKDIERMIRVYNKIINANSN